MFTIPVFTLHNTVCKMKVTPDLQVSASSLCLYNENCHPSIVMILYLLPLNSWGFGGLSAISSFFSFKADEHRIWSALGEQKNLS